MRILTKVIVLGVVGGATYLGIAKLTEPREGEITIGDLIEESRANIPGTNTATNNVGASKEATSNTDELSPGGMPLIAVSSSDQNLIRKGEGEVSYQIFTPTIIPEGFKLRPTSVSSARENGLTVFQFSFSNKESDNLFIYQYNLKEYLTALGQTLSQLTADKRWQTIGTKKIYIADSSTKTSGRFQYLQGLTLVTNATLIRVEYAGEEKLSNEDLKSIGVSFVE